ncbi:ATPase [Plantactinospora soyae]|uniref:Cell division septum initiation protein DivIVA n=1 Tax=Plantactinospora soyae TaxID=1544732 RepID=A0A927MBN6_9ACTN|nr:ATPase [Plantactinospora soyae]MBE1490196.1 cell division septum initiation protein DivIVA [Plantactinospora soyae]
MEFSVVEIGYDQKQVDRCLEHLGERLGRLAVRTDAVAKNDPELAQIRAEIDRMSGLLAAPPPSHDTSDRVRQLLLTAEREAAEILARARADLAAAREEARQVRDQVYAEAVQARREFEAALQARRIRAEQVDEILRDVVISRMPRPDADRQDHADPVDEVVPASAS